MPWLVFFQTLLGFPGGVKGWPGHLRQGTLLQGVLGSFIASVVALEPRQWWSPPQAGGGGRTPCFGQCVSIAISFLMRIEAQEAKSTCHRGGCRWWGGQGAIHAAFCTRGSCGSGYPVFVTIVEGPGRAQLLDPLAGILLTIIVASQGSWTLVCLMIACSVSP